MRIIAALCALFSLTATAAPYDYLVAFPSESAAKADPVVGQYYLSTTDSSGWRPDITFPNLLAWDSTKDTTVSCGTGCTIIQHTPYDSNWLMIITLPSRNAALEAESTTHLIVDLDSSVAGTPASVLYSWASPANLATVLIQPVPQGRTYPFGNP